MLWGVIIMKEIGEIFSYYEKIGVAAIKLNGSIKVGDRIKIQGHTTNFEQDVGSMQIEHKKVANARKGDEIGIKVIDRVRRHDKVYKVE